MPSCDGAPTDMRGRARGERHQRLLRIAGKRCAVAAHDLVVIEREQHERDTVRAGHRQVRREDAPQAALLVQRLPQHQRHAGGAQLQDARHQRTIILAQQPVVGAVGKHHVERHRRRTREYHGLEKFPEMRMPERDRLEQYARGVLVDTDDHHVARHGFGRVCLQPAEFKIEELGIEVACLREVRHCQRVQQQGHETEPDRVPSRDQ